MLTITIEYKPIPARRQSHTHAIAAALVQLKGTPSDAEGNPASFLLPAKHASALRTAAKDANVLIQTATESDQLRVWLKTPQDATAELPFKAEDLK